MQCNSYKPVTARIHTRYSSRERLLKLVMCVYIIYNFIHSVCSVDSTPEKSRRENVQRKRITFPTKSPL